MRFAMRSILLIAAACLGSLACFGQITPPPNGGGSGGSGTVGTCATPNSIAVYNTAGTVVGCVPTANNGILVTGPTGTPSISNTLPSFSVGSGPSLTPGTGAAIAFSQGTAPSVGPASGVCVLYADTTIGFEQNCNNVGYTGFAGLGTNTYSGIQTMPNAVTTDPTQANYGQRLFLQFGFFNFADGALYSLASSDGKHWGYTSGNPQSIYTATHTRDPRMILYNGAIYVCYTSQGTSFGGGPNFTIIKTTDGGQNWIAVATPSMAGTVSGTLTTWGPKWVLNQDGTPYTDSNGGPYIVVDVSNTMADTGFQEYLIRATDTTGLTTWTNGTLVSGTSLSNNQIDGLIQVKGGKFYFWYKNENTGYIEYGSSTTLGSGYTLIGTGNWAGWGTPNEGMSLLCVSSCLADGSGTWRIYFDALGSSGIYYSENSTSWDSVGTWTTKTLQTTPFTMSNPGYLAVTDSVTTRNLFGFSIGSGFTGVGCPVTFIGGNLYSCYTTSQASAGMAIESNTGAYSFLRMYHGSSEVLELGSDGSNNGYLATVTANPMTFFTSNAQHMYLSAAGGLFVGSASTDPGAGIIQPGVGFKSSDGTAGQTGSCTLAGLTATPWVIKNGLIVSCT
jgi:hypothetical protein